MRAPISGPLSSQQTGQRWRWIALALLIFITVLVLPFPSGLLVDGSSVNLTSSGRASLAIIALCLVLWVSEAIPVPVTSLGIFLLFPALGVASMADTVRSGLGHPLILFFLSLFLLSAAFVKVGLAQRTSNWILVLSQGHPDRLLLLMLVIGALISMSVNNLAAVTVLFGTSQEILKQAGLQGQASNHTRRLMLAVSWGSLIGSVGTPLGTGSNVLVMAYLDTLAGQKITFLDWMGLGLPVVLVLLPLAWLILTRVFPVEPGLLLSPPALAQIAKGNHEPVSRSERRFLLLFAVTMFLWIFGPRLEALSQGSLALPLEFVGLAAALALFLPGLELLSWDEAAHAVHWGTLLTVAGGLAAGVMLYQSGTAAWVASLLPAGLRSAPFFIFLLLTLLAIVLLRLLFTTATAAAAVLIPVVITLSLELGIDPMLVAVSAGFILNLAFILPVQAAVHLIAYSAGYYSSKDMARSGLWLTLSAALVTASLTSLAVRVLGLK